MNSIIISDVGKNLLASAVGGGDTIVFSRICTCDAEGNIRQSTPVSGITQSGNLCEAYGVLDNSELREGYCIQGLRLFAESGGGEILFGSCEEDSDPFYMPAGSEKSRTELTLRIALTTDCTNNVVLSPNSDAYASAVQLREEIARLDDAVSKKTAQEINAINSRLDVLETVVQSDITAYKTTISFGNLNGFEFNGIWNEGLKRIEF